MICESILQEETKMIKATNITKYYGKRAILRDISFEIGTGEFYVLRGDSGCGKSTLLRIIAGLENPDQGYLSLMGKPADKLAPNSRGISMVFQQAAIFSHLTVRANIAFGIRRQDNEALNRMEALIDDLALRELQHKRPAQISGGEAKRVAIARALAPDCQILLFDEALTNLDPAMKKKAFETIAHYAKDKTVLYVTHENDLEAYQAFPTFVLSDGQMRTAP